MFHEKHMMKVSLDSKRSIKSCLMNLVTLCFSSTLSKMQTSVIEKETERGSEEEERSEGGKDNTQVLCDTKNRERESR